MTVLGIFGRLTDYASKFNTWNSLLGPLLTISLSSFLLSWWWFGATVGVFLAIYTAVSLFLLGRFITPLENRLGQISERCKAGETALGLVHLQVMDKFLQAYIRAIDSRIEIVNDFISIADQSGSEKPGQIILASHRFIDGVVSKYQRMGLPALSGTHPSFGGSAPSQAKLGSLQHFLDQLRHWWKDAAQQELQEIRADPKNLLLR
jgi:hypothetical protein